MRLQRLGRLFVWPALMLSGSAFAADDMTSVTSRDQFYVVPTLGVEFFGTFAHDRGVELDEMGTIGLGFGYQTTERFALETQVRYGETEVRGTGNDVDAWQYQLDGLYAFPDAALGGHRRFEPYLAGGVGQIDFDADAGEVEDEFQLNAGVGVHTPMSRRLSLRADARVYYAPADSGAVEPVFTLALRYVLGNP